MSPPPAKVVVVEGIFALCSKLRPYLQLRVSITGGVHLDLIKRVLRDTHRSAQQPADIISQISATVYPMFKVRDASSRVGERQGGPHVQGKGCQLESRGETRWAPCSR